MSDLLIYNPNARLSIAQQRVSLPVYALRKHILYMLEKYQTLVVVGHTGCGKTTQIPQYLMESGWCAGGRCIAITQPRRISAMSVANRVSEEIGEPLDGQGKVGYLVRFDDKSSTNTQIKYMTDGMLIREMMLDPLLSRYPVVMIDEAHERSLHTDLIIGLLKKVMMKRKDLKVIVSSATLDAQDYFNYFNQKVGDTDTAAILSIEGRNYPVDIHYLEMPSVDYLKSVITTVYEIHTSQPPGDILVFLTGMEEIESTKRLLIDRLSSTKHGSYKVLPIYSGMTMEKQLKIFEPSSNHCRKIILSTNISETSITIDGIVYVVDCGFVKIKSYNGVSGLESLVTVPTSQASSNQRAGRAGRSRPGKCYRLYTQDSFNQLEVHSVPEIQRINLVSTILQLKALGIDNILAFDFISPPVPQSLVRALEILYALGTIDDSAKLTSPIGTTMAEFPTEPQFTKMILSSSSTYQCSDEIISIIAMINVPGIFVNHQQSQTMSLIRKSFGVKEGDLLTYLNIYNSFVIRNTKNQSSWCHDNNINYKAMVRVIQVRKQLLSYAKKYEIPVVSCLHGVHLNTKHKDPTIPIRKSIVSGFFTNAARLQSDGSYQTIRDKHRLWIHPTSILSTIAPPEWVIFNDVTITSKEYMRELTVIDPNWLYEIAPHFYKLNK